MSAVCQAFINSYDPHCEVGSVIITIVQMQALKGREVRELMQDHHWDRAFLTHYLTRDVLICLLLPRCFCLETYQYVFREWYNYHHHAKLFKSLKLIKGLLYNLWLSLSFTFCCIRFLFQFCVYYKCKIFKNDASWNNE